MAFGLQLPNKKAPPTASNLCRSLALKSKSYSKGEKVGFIAVWFWAKAK